MAVAVDPDLPPCPLCGSGTTSPFHRTSDRSFRRCARCFLTFVPTAGHLPPSEALRLYRCHENDPRDPGYRKFLDRLARFLPARLAPGAIGLDYGSGPGPTLSVMLEERGFSMRLYDPFFAPDAGVLAEEYDFITCTETAEHFAEPGLEFQRFQSLLRPGGWLGVMTRMLVDDEAFPRWWYHRDPTHIAFYRQETMEWIAARFGWRRESPAPDVTLFQKAG